MQKYKQTSKKLFFCYEKNNLCIFHEGIIFSWKYSSPALKLCSRVQFFFYKIRSSLSLPPTNSTNDL